MPGKKEFRKKAFENIVGKGENALKQAMSPFPTMLFNPDTDISYYLINSHFTVWKMFSIRNDKEIVV